MRKNIAPQFIRAKGVRQGRRRAHPFCIKRHRVIRSDGRRNRFGRVKQNGQLGFFGSGIEIKKAFIAIQWIDRYRGQTDANHIAFLGIFLNFFHPIFWVLRRQHQQPF